MDLHRVFFFWVRNEVIDLWYVKPIRLAVHFFQLDQVQLPLAKEENELIKCHQLFGRLTI